MKKLPKVIYVMGPPGSGKGTQAKLLAEKIGYEQFSTGDAFRAIARLQTPLGKKVKETIDNGYLASPAMAAEIVVAAVKEHVEADQGIIFDGTPRTEEEAEIVDTFFTGQEYGRPLVIFLAVSKEEMEERNSKRKFCLGIAGDFPVTNEAERSKCEKLGGTVGVRPDDEPAKYTTRWSEFTNRTKPVIDGYRQQGMLHDVDGMPEIEEVHESVMAVIGEYDV